MKKYLKKEARKLRKKGLSYSQINNLIPVSKSTLSLWLRDIRLLKMQRFVLEKRMSEARLRGAAIKKKIRQDLEVKIRDKAIRDVGVIDNRNLFLIGIALYWSEGSKVPRGRVGQDVIFSNSDWRMIKVFLKWLKNCLKVAFGNIVYELYIHENYSSRQNLIIKKWSKCLGVNENLLQTVYYKRHNVKKNYINPDYFGLMRVKILRSTNLQRKIMGWVDGVFLNNAP